MGETVFFSQLTCIIGSYGLMRLYASVDTESHAQIVSQVNVAGVKKRVKSLMVTVSDQADNPCFVNHPSSDATSLSSDAAKAMAGINRGKAVTNHAIAKGNTSV